MVTEWLSYQVPKAFHDSFLTADTAIWTAMLSQQPGFMGKQTWLNPDNPDEIIFVIQWQTRVH
jgi:uncharacterized protein (TIGR03792 family)